MQERGAGAALNVDGSGPAATGAAAVGHRLRLVAMAAAAVLAADQLTKWWALSTLDDGPIHLWWTLSLDLTFNTGSAFSLGAGRGGAIAVLALVVVGVMVWLGRGIASRPGAVALGAVLGGALGNLADRVFRAGEGFLGGAVVDFVDLDWWPVFNVADVAIVVGGVALVLTAGRSPAPPP